MRALLDTSVLIGAAEPQGIEAAISVASIAELHFGVLVADDDNERATRTQRLGAIESTFDPLPITAEVAREWVGSRQLSALAVDSPASGRWTWRSLLRQTFTACR